MVEKQTKYCQPEAGNKTFERLITVKAVETAIDSLSCLDLWRCTSCGFLRTGTKVAADP